MKLLVPHTGEPQQADARLARLAQFLGISCEPLRLEKQIQQHATYLERAVPDHNCCLVVNPQVMREWVGEDVLPAELVSCLVSHFPHLLVHAVTLQPFVASIVASLSGGALSSVHPVADPGRPYEIPMDSKDVCGPFSGLSFGPINPSNDRVFGVEAGGNTVRKLICIGDQPLMAAVRRDATQMLCLASGDVTDVNVHAGYSPLDQHFSRLMPHAMALRYIFGEECWHPCESHASIIVDDPLLRPNYGFLNFEALLRLMREHKFHTTIAFIPYNYRRNSARVLRLFMENPKYFSLCYHGNDHTQSEFASRDLDFLNSALAIAEERMRRQYEASTLRCDKVMVFPQSDFSLEAMQVLKSRNFYAAVSSAWHPLGQPTLPTAGEICQPAILRFGGFPLFGRNSVRDTRSQDVAFNIFFGKPVLTGEHHDSFENSRRLVDGVQRINAVAPGISWSNLAVAISGSFLRRRAADGTVQIRAYSPTVAVENDSESVERFCVEWAQPAPCSFFEQVLQDGAAFADAEVDDAGISARADLAPGASHTFSVSYRNSHATVGDLGLRWNAKAFLRRRLSEARDNYLSKNPQVLKALEALRARFPRAAEG